MTGNSHWVFESQDRSGEGGAPMQNLTDKRFFWLALYAQPGLWVAMAVFAVLKLDNLIWLSLIGRSSSTLGSYRSPPFFPCSFNVSWQERAGSLAITSHPPSATPDFSPPAHPLQEPPIKTNTNDSPTHYFSNRTPSHHHQHHCLLALRPLQPCRQPGLQRHVLRRAGADLGRGDV